jgi:hypothetical protein
MTTPTEFEKEIRVQTQREHSLVDFKTKKTVKLLLSKINQGVHTAGSYSYKLKQENDYSESTKRGEDYSTYMQSGAAGQVGFNSISGGVRRR